ncbi:uncharacterized protein DMAD_05757 [Drosophila madeirensis]|uniref:Uncharacterized protein n=1 Tax=Drosophila madeirensis TaxID=30013 RepID=A0AAU9FP44_DROMD
MHLAGIWSWMPLSIGPQEALDHATQLPQRLRGPEVLLICTWAPGWMLLFLWGRSCCAAHIIGNLIDVKLLRTCSETVCVPCVRPPAAHLRGSHQMQLKLNFISPTHFMHVEALWKPDII